jgi:beta-phosphoglucomutase-like phosphatase (HAD superfamily)
MLHTHIADYNGVVFKLMKAIIFGMDGVLVNTMPFHYEAMKAAVKEATDIELDKRTFYLLEGMPMTNVHYVLQGVRNHQMLTILMFSTLLV